MSHTTKKANKYLSIPAVLAVGALGLSSLTPANADAATTEQSQHDTGSIESTYNGVSNSGITDEIIDKYDDYVKLDDNGNYVLDLPEEFNANDEELAIVRGSIEQSNELADEQTSNASEMATTSSASGGFSVHWWGTQLWLNGEATADLNRILVAGGGVSALTAAIMSWTGVGGAVAGVVAGAFAAAAGVANLCNWNENGISIRNPYVGPVFCWPR